MQDYFDDEWSGAYVEPDKYFSKITGSPKGHKQKSGTWSRPDLSILTISRYEFLPMIDLELTTVEVKRYSDIGTRAIFEAASHSKYAHQSYLAYEWLDNQTSPQPGPLLEAVQREAERFGIGLIRMTQQAGSKWDCDNLSRAFSGRV